MKMIRCKLLAAAALLLFGSFAGCVTRWVSKPQGEGYGLISVRSTSDLIHYGVKCHVYYWDTKGKRTRIWNSLANQLVPDGDVALFQGQSGPGLLAVHGPGPVVDITDDVALKWAKASGTNILADRRAMYIGEITKHGHTFEVVLARVMKDHWTATLSREEILGMIQKAKQQGTLMEAPPYGSQYLKLAVQNSESE